MGSHYQQLPHLTGHPEAFRYSGMCRVLRGPEAGKCEGLALFPIGNRVQCFLDQEVSLWKIVCRN